MDKTSLTGIKPTGVPHLGNYLGAIRPALRLTDSYLSAYFIADYHALTTERHRDTLERSVYDVAATWLACGLDPDKTLFFRQSQIPEVFELAWVLSCLAATGQLERGHSYKDALARGDAPNAGVFYYPVLMAADILLYDADVVPVGQDQKQHLELARDLATRVNHVYGADTVRVPEPLLTEAPVVPGTDGQKMSKSYGNSIPLFDPPAALRKAVMGIKTGSEALDDPKDAEGSTVFQLFRLVASPDDAQTMADRLQAGGYGWGHAKEALYEALEAELAPLRDEYERLRADEAGLDGLLEEGADKARAVAQRTMERVRSAIGIRPSRASSEKPTVKLRM